MTTTSRQSKAPRKGVPEPASRSTRPPAWTGPRSSSTFSPGPANARLPNGSQPASPGFPPLAQTNGARPPDNPQDKILQQLAGLTGTTITLTTKTNQRWEGVVASTSGEGDTMGLTLRDARDLGAPGAPIRDSHFIASTNIESWASGPASAAPPNDTFKTDTDISLKPGARRERELQAWQPDAGAGESGSGSGAHLDEMTFGPGAAGSGNDWDQFAANETLFGVKAGYDEEAYTTRIDRNAPDFKEKERKAAQLANEIMRSSTSNPHVAEERVVNFVGENGANEEDRYGAVVRSANAYVPPGARKGGPAPAAPAKSDVPKVSVNAPDGSAVPPAQANTTTSSPTPPKASSPAPSASSAASKPTVDPVPAFREFVSSEKERMMKRKQALLKNEMDKRMAELVKFSQSFKLNKPIPDDLVPILAKDADKQRQIIEKSTKDAESGHARAIGVSAAAAAGGPTASVSTNHISPVPSTAKAPAAITRLPTKASTPVPKSSASATAKPAEANGKTGRIGMFIQPIPPFKGKRTSAAPSTNSPAPVVTAPPPTRVQTNSNNSNGSAGPLSPTAANRLNVNASSFRPNVKANAFPPSAGQTNSGNNANGSTSSSSPKNKPAESSQGPPNPFFGTRSLKKNPPVHIKDDFNPFKYHKVVEASQVAAVWPYTGKRYMQMFPPLPTQPQQPSPHMAPPGPPPTLPPPSYEEDSAAQAAARGYVYAYPPYGYPGQPMMPGMGPPPPGAYIPGPYMQPMPFPPHMHPQGAMYPTTPMGQMPPPPPGVAYMQPPPGAYPPPPNGGPRPSMPPTPIPSHAHPYYHQSPQLQHAVPYQMMMPPPGPGVPHPYDGSQPPPVPMGGHA